MTESFNFTSLCTLILGWNHTKPQFISQSLYKAVPYEEALLRAQLSVKPMTDELKEQVFLRIVKPKFIEYLAKEKDDKK